jgi:mannosyltransferase OCH1-like enzyme
MNQVPIFKADILRYLLLFSEGGVYCDLAKRVTKIPHSQPKIDLSQSSSLLITSLEILLVYAGCSGESGEDDGPLYVTCFCP